MPQKKHPKKPFSFLDSRDVSYMKPNRYQDHKTLGEVAREIGVDVSWLRKLERADRIPKATRVQRGSLSVRLWSPAQVEEIGEIISQHRPGRPPGEIAGSHGR